MSAIIRRILRTLGFVVVTVACVLGIVTVTPAALPRTTKVAPPQDVKAVCIPAGTQGSAHLVNATAAAGLGQPLAPAKPDTALAASDAPTVVTGVGALAAGTASGDAATRAWVPCTSAVARGSLVLPSPRHSRLVLVNADQGQAVVDLTLHGPDGEIRALGARGIAIGPQQSQEVALSVLADVAGPVGVDFQTSAGRVTVAAVISEGAVQEALTAAEPARQLVLPGVPAGAGTATVAIANPGEERATVQVHALGSTPDYIPAGADEIEVPPLSTVAVALAPSLAGEASTLVVAADRDVTASLTVSPVPTAEPATADVAFVAPVAPATRVAAFVPSGGALQLTATSGDAVADVVIGGKAQQVRVPAGTTVVVPDAVTTAHALSVVSDQPLVAALVQVAGPAAAVVPLQDVVGNVAEPLEAVVDPRLR